MHVKPTQSIVWHSISSIARTLLLLGLLTQCASIPSDGDNQAGSCQPADRSPTPLAVTVPPAGALTATPSRTALPLPATPPASPCPAPGTTTPLWSSPVPPPPAYPTLAPRRWLTGSASGSLDGVALKPLTVDFHEPGFVSSLNGENGQPFWFQMSDEQRQKAGSPWGPANPQALNRYSYVQNNPMRYVDPSGHTVRCYPIIGCIGGVVYNDSPYDVEVTGERRKDTAACRTSTSQSCFETVTATLHQGESSADYGIVDADKVRALDPAHPIDGHGPNDGAYDLIDGQEVHIREKKSDWFEVFLLGGRSWNYGVVLEWQFRPGFAGGAGQYGYYLDDRKPGWTTDPYNKGRQLTDKDKITGR